MTLSLEQGGGSQPDPRSVAKSCCVIICNPLQTQGPAEMTAAVITVVIPVFPVFQHYLYVAKLEYHSTEERKSI